MSVPVIKENLNHEKKIPQSIFIESINDLIKDYTIEDIMASLNGAYK